MTKIVGLGVDRAVLYKGGDITDLQFGMPVAEPTGELPKRPDPRSWDEFLSRFTYRPFYEFRCVDEAYSQARIEARFFVENTYNRSERIRIVFARSMPAYSMFPSYMAAKECWRHRFIYDLEQHEADEWMRFDGEMTFDPHNI